MEICKYFFTSFNNSSIDHEVIQEYLSDMDELFFGLLHFFVRGLQLSLYEIEIPNDKK